LTVDYYISDRNVFSFKLASKQFRIEAEALNVAVSMNVQNGKPWIRDFRLAVSG